MGTVLADLAAVPAPPRIPAPLPARFAATAFVLAIIVLGPFACGGASPTGASASSAGDPPQPATLRVVSWNVQHGYTPSRQHVNGQQIEFLAGLNPDVVAFQEMAEWDNDMPAIYRDGLQSRTGRAWTILYQATLPGAAKARREGPALATWLPVSGRAPLAMPDAGAADDLNRNRAAVRFAVTVGGQVVHLATTQLDYLDGGNRRAELDRVQRWMAEVGPRVVVAGDFNAEPDDQATWQAWLGEYSDAWLSEANPLRAQPGWTKMQRSTTGRPARIDYAWYRGLRPASVRLVETDLSDHYALVVDFEVGRQ
ncbi:MAG: hypothetical protein EHM24_00400 [Acidobacteria bacterium]|nr:MAG: hypothetical protein EHM24_11815 [Acidobacteriota bacterium]RPJ77285.1 MAG: hypothetical protein EHM24_00400 [Acidobacteriota bacterium]